MRQTIHARNLAVLVLSATLVLATTATHARGPRGGRSGGGSRVNATSPGGRITSPRPSNLSAGSNLLSSGATNLSTRVGDGGAGLLDASQFQGTLQQQLIQRDNQRLQSQEQLSQQHEQLQQNAQNWANQFQNRPEPFTPAWYAEHPNAWRNQHPHADATVVASTAAVAAWVGANAYAPAYGGSSATVVVYESDPPTDESDYADADGGDAQAAPSEPAGTWLPIGVYAMSTAAQAPATLMLQLVVDHDGKLQGVYYDSITNTSHNLSGAVDQTTLVAHWSLESSEQVAFQAPLEQLTQPSGTLQVNLPAGPQEWRLVRVENPGH